MAISNFIPEIWSASIIENFKAAQSVIPTVNSSFEGEVATGNQVNITTIATPDVQDYADNGRVLTIDALSDSSVPLLINQEKAISFKVDDVDRVQAAGSFDSVTADAGRALAEDAETYVINEMATYGQSVGTSAISDGDDAFGVVNDIRTALGKAKVPSMGRFLVVNPEFAALLLSAGSKLTNASVAGTDGELRNGVIGSLLGFTVIESSVFDNGTEPAAIGYHGAMVGYVGQIAKTEAGRMELAFADYIRALNVYGAKVLKAEAVQTWIVPSGS